MELLFDPDTESAVRSVWAKLSDVGLRSPGPTSRPHVTMVVAEGISEDVDELLRPVARRMPFGCLIGAPVLFGESSFTLVRMVVASAELLSLQSDAYLACQPYLTPGPAPNTVPGKWTPHVTLARRAEPAQLVRALSIRRLGRDIKGSFVGLRRWDGNKRIEHVID